eukprot:INCI1036.1.p1 GENE.INCI1036.1~~INCI1036.1.p1  ORF type:complete len:543 (-),score=80.72 INCI1036.1:1284-2912(-)
MIKNRKISSSFVSVHHEFLTSSSLQFESPQGPGSPAGHSSLSPFLLGFPSPDSSQATSFGTSKTGVPSTNKSPFFAGATPPASSLLVPSSDDFDELDRELDTFSLDGVCADFFGAPSTAVNDANATAAAPQESSARSLQQEQPLASHRSRGFSEDLAAAFLDFRQDAWENQKVAAEAQATSSPSALPVDSMASHRDAMRRPNPSGSSPVSSPRQRDTTCRAEVPDQQCTMTASFKATSTRLQQIDFSACFSSTPRDGLTPRGDANLAPGMSPKLFDLGPLSAIGSLLSPEPGFDDDDGDELQVAKRNRTSRHCGRSPKMQPAAPSLFDNIINMAPHHAQHLPISELRAAQKRLEQALALRTAQLAHEAEQRRKNQKPSGASATATTATAKVERKAPKASKPNPGAQATPAPVKRKRRSPGGGVKQRRVTKWQRELRGVLRACLWELRFHNGAITELSRRYNIPIRTLRRYKHASLNPSSHPTANDNVAITFPPPVNGEAVPRPPREVCQYLRGFSWHAYEGEEDTPHPAAAAASASGPAPAK